MKDLFLENLGSVGKHSYILIYFYIYYLQSKGIWEYLIIHCPKVRRICHESGKDLLVGTHVYI